MSAVPISPTSYSKTSMLWLISYLLGAIPFSLIVSKFYKVDLLKSGSGNLGATNVYRTMGLKAAILVFALDATKGFIPVYLAQQFSPNPTIHILAGLIAILGHSLSIFVKFKGGKGAATGIGVLTALSPITAGILFPLAVTIILVTRYVSVATLMCSALAPILLFFFHAPRSYIYLTMVASIFIWYRHKANIRRLIQGLENRV